MEKVVFKHVYNYIKDNNLISPHQSGFKPGDSTVNQLSYLYHIFCEALDKKKDVRIVFCDISKAFDRVWHDGLLYKLHKFGIHGNLLNWFKDYLSNWKQRVLIRGQQSELGDIKAGVPQGSNLGPLLFLVYIEDLTTCVQSNIKLFADDTSLYIDFENPYEAKQILNSDLENIKEWANQWLVKFSPSKTKSMTMTFKKRQNPALTFDNSDLVDVENHRHLGITLSNNLSWSKHISTLLENVSPMADVLRKLKYSIDRESLEKIYFTFVRPKLEYGSHIWDGCRKIDSDALENFQLEMARIVTGAIRGTSHQLLYEELNWPLLKDRRTNMKLKYFCRLVTGDGPEYLSELIPKADPKLHNLRNANNIPLPKCRTESYKKSFLPSSISLWNDLPLEDRNLDVINQRQKFIPIKLYQFGQRTQNIKHAQLRLRCSKLNAHLFLLHVKDSPSCACGFNFEDCEHYFMQCPLFLVQRQILQTKLQTIGLGLVSCDILLYGSANLDVETNYEIFSAVHEFIRDTDRL